jgi:hypothetical protein
MQTDVVLDLGWGRLIFGQTFGDLRRIADEFRREEAGQRDICIYPRDPHVLVGLAPDELFIDPSYTYRLDLHRYRPRAELIRGVFVRTVTARVEMERINEIYALNGMVAGDADVMWRNHRTRAFTYLVALGRRPPERRADPRAADGEPAHRRHHRGRHRPGCTPRSRPPRYGPRPSWASRSPAWTSWCPTSAVPTTSSSRPTSGPGWPTTSRSRSSSGSWT